MAVTSGGVQRAVRKYLAEEKAAALIYRPESAAVVAQDAADMKRILGEGGSQRLPAIPPRVPVATPSTKVVQLEKEEAGVSGFRTGEGIPVLVRNKDGAPMARIGVYSLSRAIAGATG